MIPTSVQIIIGSILILLAVFLTIVVLLQEGKSSKLSGAIAGGSETYMSKSKSGNLDQVLANSTKWIALVWVFLTLVLSLI